MKIGQVKTLRKIIFIGLSVLLLYSLYFSTEHHNGKSSKDLLLTQLSVGKSARESGHQSYKKKQQESSFSSKNLCNMAIASILCQADSYLSIHKADQDLSKANLLKDQNNVKRQSIAKDFSRQLNQLIVMLKSIAVQEVARHKTDSNHCITVYLLTDNVAQFDKLTKEISSGWTEQFSSVFRLHHIPVKYPTGFDWMSRMFRPCATLRLFIPSLMPTDVQMILYLDTDFVFLNSLKNLWQDYGVRDNNGRDERGRMIAAMAPCLFHYGSKSNLVPFYGRSGLNAGLMLMNLSRMRDTAWNNKINLISSAFKKSIKLADQDILNIYFHFFPEELVEVSCDWNFRPFQCREGSYCEDKPLFNGISAIHGNALSFTNQGPEPLFKIVFDAFSELQLNEKFDLQEFVEDLEAKLLLAEEKYFRTSDCSKYGGFSALVLSRLDELITNQELTN